MKILTLRCSQLIGPLPERRIKFRPGKGKLGLIARERPAKDAKICNGTALEIAFPIAAQAQRLPCINLALQLGSRLISQGQNRFAIQVKTHPRLLTAAIVSNHEVVPRSRLELSQMLNPGENGLSLVTRQPHRRHTPAEFNQPTSILFFVI